jgi:hypothetical protein
MQQAVKIGKMKEPSFKVSSVSFGQRQHQEIIFPTALVYIVCKIAVEWQNESFIL